MFVYILQFKLFKVPAICNILSILLIRLLNVFTLNLVSDYSCRNLFHVYELKGKWLIDEPIMNIADFQDVDKLKAKI